jgi:twitching motility protein PilT
MSIPPAPQSFLEILQAAAQWNASDVHIKAGAPVVFRINGELTPVDFPAPAREQVQEFIERIAPPDFLVRLRAEHEVDFSFEIEGVGRFRTNVFHQRGVPVCAMRLVKAGIRSIAELNLPAIVERLCDEPQGLILVAGATGAGKSATLAAMVEHINERFRKHIITLEDPIEYIFQDKNSVIEQREIGIDTASFSTALRSVLRQDPDVIMIGEMRDAESFIAAMRAVTTGHLVLSTLHTADAAQSISRILGFFAAAEQEQIRRQLAPTLSAVICQKLVAGKNAPLVPAVEILIANPVVRGLIEDNRLDALPAAIETGSESGMQSFNQALYRMVQERKIDQTEALAHSPNAEALKMNLQGIFLDGGSRRLIGGGRGGR